MRQNERKNQPPASQRANSSTDWMFQRNAPEPVGQSTDRLPPVETKQPVRRPRQRRGRRLFIGLLTVTIIAIVLVIGAMIASEMLVKPMVADRVEAELGREVESFVSQELAALPVPVDAPQQYLISEGELNQRIAEQPDLGPLDNATAEINADGIVVHLSAYRMTGTYRAQVVETNGAVNIVNSSLSGPLSYVIPVEEMERAANDAIHGSLIASNLRVTDVTLVDGEIVLTLVPAGA